MKVQVSISAPIAPQDFADVVLHIENEVVPCRLRFDFATLRKLVSIPAEQVVDLLLLAAVVYSLDRRVIRGHAVDAWTRTFSVTLPVAAPELWQPASPLLNRCLTFLTGDVWEISFTRRSERLVIRLPQRRLGLETKPQAVSLFSGGLDSLIGVIDYLETNTDDSLVLVGHHDPRIGSAFSEQRLVHEELERLYPGRTQAVLPWIGADSGRDTTLRSRSFLFLALGVYIAQIISDTTPVLIPENGTIALNVPLTPSRTGSCSTRTTHPHFLAMLNEMLRILGLGTTIVNPLQEKTKGECVSQCLNRDALTQIAHITVSCAKRGHTRTWVQRHAKQCGRCMPCIYRRAALHTVGLDTEMYGRDICEGDVDLMSEIASADDFRACVSFLRRGLLPNEIGDLLIQNGKLPVGELDAYARLVVRAMDEIRQLLRDKASEEIKRYAGI